MQCETKRLRFFNPCQFQIDQAIGRCSVGNRDLVAYQRNDLFWHEFYPSISDKLSSRGIITTQNQTIEATLIGNDCYDPVVSKRA
jgi:hypothetical protein